MATTKFFIYGDTTFLFMHSCLFILPSSFPNHISVTSVTNEQKDIALQIQLVLNKVGAI
jgi:hypothetical protein